MAKLLDCGSICSVALAVNAVLPTIIIAFRRTHEVIAKRWVEALAAIDPKLAPTPERYGEFLRYVKGTSTGLRFTDRAKYVLLVLLGSAVVWSFIGLVFSATSPNHIVSDSHVWIFSVYTLLICPSLALGFEMWCRYVERAMLERGFEDHALLRYTGVSFGIVMKAQEDVREMEGLVAKYRAQSLKFARGIRRYRWNQFWRDIRWRHIQLRMWLRLHWPPINRKSKAEPTKAEE
jgi:hypothetical protein